MGYFKCRVFKLDLSDFILRAWNWNAMSILNVISAICHLSLIRDICYSSNSSIQCHLQDLFVWIWFFSKSIGYHFLILWLVKRDMWIVMLKPKFWNWRSVAWRSMFHKIQHSKFHLLIWFPFWVLKLDVGYMGFLSLRRFGCKPLFLNLGIGMLDLKSHMNVEFQKAILECGWLQFELSNLISEIWFVKFNGLKRSIWTLDSCNSTFVIWFQSCEFYTLTFEIQFGNSIFLFGIANLSFVKLNCCSLVLAILTIEIASCIWMFHTRFGNYHLQTMICRIAMFEI